MQKHKIFHRFLFSDQRIAVEIDENNHNAKQYSSDQERQKFIEDKLRCTFIRCNPDKNALIFLAYYITLEWS